MIVTEEQDLVISPPIARLLRERVAVERALDAERAKLVAAIVDGGWSPERCAEYDLLRERHAAAAHDVASLLRVVLDTYGQPA